MQSPNPNSFQISTAAFPPKEINPTVKSSKGSMEEDTLQIALEVLEELKLAAKNKIGCGDSKTMVANSSSGTSNPSQHDLNKGKKKRATKDHVAKITLADLVKYFDMPIVEASKNLDIGTTVLKRKCREFGLPRWPHRKIKSLDSLIHDLHQEEEEHKEMENKAEAMAMRMKQKMVEKEKERIEKNPFTAIQCETKRLRQHVFKRKHKARVIEKKNSKVASK